MGKLLVTFYVFVDVMYEQFYGLRDNPFRLTPDPEYLFLSANHQEALGHLLFGINEGSGVVVITGEIGAGKTTLLRTLVRNLDDRTIVAYIFNPALSALELLQTINADLGLPATSSSKKELIDELNRFLLAQQTAGRRVVVIVDEAQDLEPGVLEQLRLLSNLETEREKLLQIMLVGQPELRAMLARPELAQLDQRVTLRWHLGPLDADETAAYVRHRLRVASGGRESVRFMPNALALIYRVSRGVPRVINIICHRALLIGYTREERQINRTIIRQATKELGRAEPPGSPSFRELLFSKPAVAMAGLILLVGALFFLASTPRRLPFLTPSQSQETATPSPPSEEGAKEAPVLAAVPSQAQSPAPVQPTETPLASPAAVPSQAQSPVPAPVETPLASPAAASVASPLHSASDSSVQSQVPASATAPQPEDQSERTMTEQAFLEELQRSELVDSAMRAANGLLRVWGVHELQTGEWRNGALDLTTIARTRRLEYLPLNGAVNLLSLLDLPVILELVTPVRGETRFVLLLGITTDRCRVLLDREREIPLRVLNEYWFGKAHLFWKDFENVGILLTVGSIGQNVRRLHTLLSKVQGTDGKPFPGRLDTFSRQTEERVARFQKAKRLTPDGVIGPQTMVVLYNSLPGYSHPSLKTMGNATADTPVETPGKMTQAGSTPNASLAKGGT